MKNKDFWGSIVFLVVAGVLFTYSSTYPVKEGGIAVLNPGFYPKLLSVILGVLSVALLVTSLRNPVQQKGSAGVLKSKKAIFLFSITLFLLVLYPFLLDLLGFASSSFIFIFFLIFFLTEDAKKKLFFILPMSLALSLLMFVIFKVILKIPFPSGILI